MTLIPLTWMVMFQIKEAARLLGVSDKRVYQYVMSGRLSAQRIGHILIIPVEERGRFGWFSYVVCKKT